MTFQNVLTLVATVCIAAFVAFFSTPYHTSPALLQSQTAATTTFAVVPNSLPQLFSGFSPLFPLLKPAPQVAPTSTIATTTKQQTKVATRAPLVPATKPKQPIATTTTKTAAVVATSSAPSESAVAASTAVGLARDSVVNIICISRTNSLHSASGSGVIVDPRGIILTAAHVAQYFLLTDYPKPGDVRCVIRTGSPAKSAYLVKLIYISPNWVESNPSTLTQSAPVGTGQDDFAFLAITDSVTDAPLPTSFSYLPLSSDTPVVGDKVSIGTYGAEFLSSNQIQSSLYPIIVFGTISERFTFKTSTVDLISVDGTAAAQEGSSGGAIINSKDQLIGLITTSTITSSIATRNLHAITPSHIRQSFMSDTGNNLDQYLKDNTLQGLVTSFEGEAAVLTRTLEKHLP
jgi:S1-C subfamily serine protease